MFFRQTLSLPALPWDFQVQLHSEDHPERRLLLFF
jgi:hypothetical protein